MWTGFLARREQLMRIEIACARVSDLLERARRLETSGSPALAEAARERAALELETLDRPRPTSPHPTGAVRRAA